MATAQSSMENYSRYCQAMEAGVMPRKTEQLYGASRLCIPSEGDILDSVPVQNYLSENKEYAKRTICQRLTVLPLWQISRLLQADAGQKPTEENLNAALVNVPKRLNGVTDRLEIFRGN